MISVWNIVFSLSLLQSTAFHFEFCLFYHVPESFFFAFIMNCAWHLCAGCFSHRKNTAGSDRESGEERRIECNGWTDRWIKRTAGDENRSANNGRTAFKTLSLWRVFIDSGQKSSSPKANETKCATFRRLFSDGRQAKSFTFRGNLIVLDSTRPPTNKFSVFAFLFSACETKWNDVPKPVRWCRRRLSTQSVICEEDKLVGWKAEKKHSFSS